MRFTLIVSLLLLVCLAATACSSHKATAARLPEPESIGDPLIGEVLFNEGVGDDAPPCIFCHSVDTPEDDIAPSLMDVANRADKQVEGLDAVNYLRQSILEPSAFVADGHRVSRMYRHYAENLSDEQVDALVAYLLTL